MKGLLLVMVCGAPWAFGAVGDGREFYLLVSVALLLVLWAVRMLAEWRVSWTKCPLILCLALLFLSGIWQLVPLPKHVLSVVSPATASLYDQLLPAEPEEPPLAQHREPLDVQAGSTISLYPHETRRSLLRLLALVLLFVIVRNNFSSFGAIRQLSTATVINGSALALFGIVQFFSTQQKGTIYWSVETAGAAFGPFVNRNHFAFYINICIGLGVGLLLSRNDALSRETARHSLSERGSFWQHATRLLHDPLSMWLVGGLTLMLSSVVFCLSRGGFLALLIASTVCLLCSLSCRRRRWKPGALIVTIASAISLLVWLGLDPVEARLSTLWDGEAYRGGRGFLLEHCWPVIAQYPIWGTGFGTFQHVEALYLHTPADVGTLYEHAHNDYLEDMIEGGFVRLALRLTIIALVFRYGYRAFRHSTVPWAGAMGLGLLFSFTTIVVHSFVEFGLFIPAIATLAVVVMAHLSGLGASGSLQLPARPIQSDAAAMTDRPPSPESYRLTGPTSELRGILPALGAATCFLLALVLYDGGKRAARAEELHGTALYMRSQALTTMGGRAEELRSLHAALSFAPHDAQLRFLLAEAYFDLHQGQLQRADIAADEGQRTDSSFLVPGLWQTMLARDLCPLLSAPHARLAFYRDAFAKAEPRQEYLRRTKLLAPADPQLWYLCGRQELADGRREEAFRSWHRSLELSDQYFVSVVEQSAAAFGTEMLVDHVLPQRPALLLRAAMHLFPEEAAHAERRPILEKGLEAFARGDFDLQEADQLYAKAVICRMLGKPDEAVGAYQAALAQSPLQSHWRQELAALLYEAGRFLECRREVQAILAHEPTNAAAAQLGERASREIAEARLQRLRPAGR